MKSFLGIELGSTRIKAVLIDQNLTVLASGGFNWENRFEDGVWTYHLDDVWRGLRESFADLLQDFQAKHKQAVPDIAGIGISAMMHGYLVFDKADKQLAPFRTWRNTLTEEAAGKLSDVFDINIPQRWSVAHLYQMLLDGAEHTKEVAYLATLSSYVHYKLTGRKVLGVSDASGMFPVDAATNEYQLDKLAQFDELAQQYNVPWKLIDILPQVLVAGEDAGTLTAEGAALLDPGGLLQPGIPLCPPEGDAGTGLVATNSVLPGTGNVSVGTSIFALLVLEKPLSRRYEEIDIITTPTGKPVALVHCNNGTSDLDAWVRLFGTAVSELGGTSSQAELYRKLYEAALTGDPDGGGVIACNYLSGEHITGLHEGRPLVIRTPDSQFTLANFMRSLLFSTMASLRIGMNILTKKEGVTLQQILGHGGLFKTALVGQKLMAGALNTPVAVLESAGEGGAWGIALLAAYAGLKQAGESFEAFLAEKAFADAALITVAPDPADVQGFAAYLERYQAMLTVQRVAVESIPHRKGG